MHSKWTVAEVIVQICHSMSAAFPQLMNELGPLAPDRFLFFGKEGHLLKLTDSCDPDGDEDRGLEVSFVLPLSIKPHLQQVMCTLSSMDAETSTSLVSSSEMDDSNSNSEPQPAPKRQRCSHDGTDRAGARALALLHPELVLWQKLDYSQLLQLFHHCYGDESSPNHLHTSALLELEDVMGTANHDGSTIVTKGEIGVVKALWDHCILNLCVMRWAF